MMGYKEAISQLSKYVLCKSAQHIRRDPTQKQQAAEFRSEGLTLRQVSACAL